MSGEESWSDGFTLPILDYVILGASVVIVVGIAIWTSFKNKNTTQDFFTARHSIGPFPVAMSFLSTFISGYMIMAFSGEIYGYGLEFGMAIVGGAIGIVVCTFMNLKVFYDLKLATVYEYFELRYNSFGLRMLMMGLQVLSLLITMGIASTGPCLILAAVTPVDIKVYCFIVGILCAFYATVGGMRGIIWTDTFMMLVMMIGMVAVIIVGSFHLGPSEIWSIASEGGRTTFFNFNPSLYQRHNSYLLFIHGFLLFGKMYGTSQISLQRAYSLRSFADYKRSLIILVISYLVVHGVIFAAGIVAYSIYAGCDPIGTGQIDTIDQILPHLISDKLGYFPGISGLFLASMVCAGVSTVSSMMNSFSNLIYGDILVKMKSFQNLSDRTVLIVCKTMTMLTAIPAIGISLLVTRATSIMPIAMTVFGILLAPVFGIFFLALLFPMSRLVGAVAGFIASLTLLVWFVFGKALYGHPDKLLPFSTESCEFSVINGTLGSNFMNESIPLSIEDDMDSSGSMYDVSYTFFSVFGTLTCLLVGLIVSYLAGPEKAENIPEKYISPFVRKLFYKKSKTESTNHLPMNGLK